MSAPRITTTGCVVSVGGGTVVFDGANPQPGDDGCKVPATPEIEIAYSPLLFRRDGIRITIEPADAPEEPPAHGSALDYLGQLKTVLSGLADVHDGQTDDQNHRAIRRCMSLANSASLAILNAQRGRT